MSKRVLIKPAVPAVYLTLEDGEEVCQVCYGKGEVRQLYSSQGFESSSDWMVCRGCGGDGKRLRCIKCGNLELHGRLRRDDSSFDDLCFECIKELLGSKVEVQKQHEVGE